MRWLREEPRHDAARGMPAANGHATGPEICRPISLSHFADDDAGALARQFVLRRERGHAAKILAMPGAIIVSAAVSYHYRHFHEGMTVDERSSMRAYGRDTPFITICAISGRLCRRHARQLSPGVFRQGISLDSGR